VIGKGKGWAGVFETKTKNNMKKKAKQQPAQPQAQALDYSSMSRASLDSCEAQLKSLVETTRYPEMKKEYLARLAKIEAAREKRSG